MYDVTHREDRPRSYSLGELAAQNAARPHVRHGTSSPGISAEQSTSDDTNTPMQRQNSLSAVQPGSLAGSGRASPALSMGSRRSLRTNSQRGSSRMIPPPLSSTTSSGLSSHVPPALKNLDSYSSRNVAAALEADTRQVDDVWQAVCVRVLPLLYVGTVCELTVTKFVA